MRWQDEQTQQDVKLRQSNRPDTGFLSWSNYIKVHKEDAAKRYEVAQAFLPSPLGFKESVLALRALIRDKKKQQVDFESELHSLYHLAAWESFYPKHSTALDEPGFKIFDYMPGGMITALEIEYQKLGYEQLKLINKTDAKLLVQYYGEPQQHSTLYALYPKLWQQAEARYAKSLDASNKAADIQLTCQALTQPKARGDTHNTSTQASMLPASGLSSASKKYDATGKVIAPAARAPRPKKYPKLQAQHKLGQRPSSKHKYLNKAAKAKQLSLLMVQAIKDRTILQQRLSHINVANIKQTLSNKKLLSVLGVSYLVVNRARRLRTK
ncbi:hypothetical protein [Psychrobacter sanguinis]|uniref:Uncharacterized protein n=1 Tax=Psychrobacter sanguinis TaxID=861445 RepID=A0A844LY70_9GAMM|nr:hypothetical protein [Psychrobacter sanguinis]MUG31217.1 hypothetical protein [Psychrobacter sanguinis]